ncbi:MAG: nucleoside hydrolase [Planctomycetaceae bacterium]|nr:nucleoside hydrolase [Planctomycetaceae bacterium]
MPSPIKKLIIDLDPGIGDSLAVAIALNDPQVDVLGLTAVAGCVSPRNATLNLQRIVEQIDPVKWPRIGAAAPLISGRDNLAPVDLGCLAPLNGASGLGDTDFPVADLHHRHEAAKLLVDLVRNDPHEITLVTLGPLTNVMAACERMPEFLSMLGGLVCLGGTIQGPGDITPVAELNFYVSPEAARLALTTPATTLLVPTDTTLGTVMTFEHLAKLGARNDSRTVGLLQRLPPYALRSHHHYLGVEGIPIREVVAMAAAVRPQLFKTQQMRVDVELRGELTRGMAVFDRRNVPGWRSNIEVAVEADSRGILDYVMSTLKEAV